MSRQEPPPTLPADFFRNRMAASGPQAQPEAPVAPPQTLPADFFKTKKATPKAPFMSYLNRGIGLGFTFGFGADSYIKGMNYLGIGAATEEPTTLGQRVAQGVGVTLGSAPSMALGAYAAATKGVGMVAQIGETLFSPFLQSPAASLLAETGAGVGLGTIILPPTAMRTRAMTK